MRKYLIILAILLTVVCVQAVEPSHQLVRVYLTQDSDVIKLARMDLDIARVEKGKYAEIITVAEETEALRKAGFRVEVVIEDMEKNYREKVNPQQDEMGGFLTYTELVARLNQIHSENPTLTTAPYSIGQSWEGRDMWVIKVSDNPDVDEDEPEVWYDGLHHAREPIGMQLLIYFIEYLMDNYGVIPEVTEAVAERELFFLPVSNPDGYCYNELTNPNGGGMWRKNRRNNGGSYGVDLNRNYPYYWGYNDVGSSSSPSSETYRGPSAGSEPEVQAIMNYINTRHIALSHSYHSYGDLILYPWGVEDLGVTPDNTDFMAMANQMSLYNGYEPGTPWQLLYDVNGGSFDWQYGQQDEHYKIMAFSLEVGGSFWPSPTLIPQLCQENVAVNLYSALIAEDYAPPEVYLAEAGIIVDDSAYNNNGTADPGETVNLAISLRNTGTMSAQNITSVLESSDIYLTVISSASIYPNIASLGVEDNYTPFIVAVSSTCPAIYETTLDLIVTYSFDEVDTIRMEFNVGNPQNNPTGPDQYGYLAYDQADGHIYGDYTWIELDPVYGGSGGTPILFNDDDQTVQRDLPFTFRYYGQDYTQISICTNGWIAMGSTASVDYSNSPIPNPDGPPAMLAAFWEDLSPQLSGSVLTYYDAVNHYYIVEYSRVREYTPANAFETFEAILYDPAFYPTLTGDGMVKYQYHTIQDNLSCTVGIENLQETDGLQVLYNNNLNPNSHPIVSQSAVIFTTGTEALAVEVTLTPAVTPVTIPAAGGSFNYTITIHNGETDPVTFDTWIEAALPAGSIYSVLVRQDITLNPGVTLSRNMTQNVPGSAPQGEYLYSAYTGVHPNVVYSSDSFPFTKLGVDLSVGGGWDLSGWDEMTDGITPSEFTLGQNYPNPFNPSTNFEFAVPSAGKVEIAIFNITGQLVEKLIDGNLEAGYYNITWNAEQLPSGVYFYRMEGEGFSVVKKCVLMK